MKIAIFSKLFKIFFFVICLFLKKSRGRFKYKKKKTKKNIKNK